MKIKTKCDNCNKVIYKLPCIMKSHKHHFCSRKCHFKFKIKLRFKVNCDNCGKVLFLHLYKKKNKRDHHFCDFFCFQKFRSKNALIETQCGFCKKKFKIKKIRKTKQKIFFCCKKCFYSFKKQNSRKIVICLECRRLFKVYKCILKLEKGKFCCKKCFLKNSKKNHYKEFNCFFCNKKIVRKKSKLKRYHNRGYFCSKKCYGKWSSQNIRGEKHHNYNKRERKCSFCKKKLFIINSAFKKNKMSFCNRRCYGKWISKNRIGKNSYGWIDGSTLKEYPRAFNHLLKEFIRKRDNYICQNENCKVPQKECIKVFHVHHIDYNRKNNDPINLILLCQECHYKIKKHNHKYWQEYYENLQIKRKVHLLEQYIK